MQVTNKHTALQYSFPNYNLLKMAYATRKPFHVLGCRGHLINTRFSNIYRLGSGALAILFHIIFRTLYFYLTMVNSVCVWAISDTMYVAIIGNINTSEEVLEQYL